MARNGVVAQRIVFPASRLLETPARTKTARHSAPPTALPLYPVPYAKVRRITERPRHIRRTFSFTLPRRATVRRPKRPPVLLQPPSGCEVANIRTVSKVGLLGRWRSRVVCGKKVRAKRKTKFERILYVESLRRTFGQVASVVLFWCNFLGWYWLERETVWRSDGLWQLVHELAMVRCVAAVERLRRVERRFQRRAVLWKGSPNHLN